MLLNATRDLLFALQVVFKTITKFSMSKHKTRIIFKILPRTTRFLQAKRTSQIILPRTGTPWRYEKLFRNYIFSVFYFNVARWCQTFSRRRWDFPNIIAVIERWNPPTIYLLPQSTCRIIVSCPRSTDVNERSFIPASRSNSGDDLSLSKDLIDYPRFAIPSIRFRCLWQTIVACFIGGKY